MTISKELLLAILSMDSYHRGYGDGLGLTGTAVGDAIILEDSHIFNSDPNDPNRVDEAAGFYAVAYNVGGTMVDGVLTGGETIISYRGTDI